MKAIFKTQTRNVLRTGSVLNKIFAILAWALLSCTIPAQTQIPTQLNSISIPDDQLDFLTLDICSSEGDQYLPKKMLFLYNMRKILILNAEDKTDIIGEIQISDFGKNSEQYTELYRIPAIAFMAYNKDDHELYFMTPDMKINCVRFSIFGGGVQISDVVTIIDPIADGYLESCNGVQGYSIIRYNNVTDRLYWVVNGTNSTVSNGMYVNCYFGIYKRNGISNFSQITAPTIYTINIDIYDVTYNDNNDLMSEDFFYISKDNVWEIWKIDANNTLTIENSQDISGGHNPVKNGWFLKTNIGLNYKVFCLPHDNHFATNPNANHGVFVIDGNATTPVFANTNIILPDSRVYFSGAYIPSSNEIILSILPATQSEQLLYRYSANAPYGSTAINLDESKSNYCKHITLDQFGNLILGRKDGITVYYHTGSYDNIISKFNNYYFESLETTTIPTAPISYITTMSPISSGIETIISSGAQYSIDNTSPFTTGAATYSSFFNPMNECSYFFSRSFFENGKIYYLDNNLEVGTINDFSDAIGDCIYNPYANEVLVSTFSDQGKIKKYSNSNTFSSEIDGYNFCEKLYISPDNRLFAASNMSYKDNTHSKITIFEADTYNPITSYTDVHSWSLDNGTRIKATFAFDNSDNSVAVIVSPVVNTATNLHENLLEQGIYYSISNNNVIGIEKSLTFNPREAYYCGPENRLVVSTSSGIMVYDEGNETWDQHLNQTDICGLSYNNYDYKLYIIGNNSSGSKLWEFDCSTFSAPVEKFDFENQDLNAWAIYSNEQNKSIIIMAYPLGINTNRDIKCFEFDPQDNYSYQTYNTGNSLTTGRSLYFHYQQNMFTHDPINMRTFYPNGMFSNISLRQYDTENISLQDDGITWLSFPRLNREPSGNMSSITALDGRIEVELVEDDEGNMKGQNADLSGLLYIDWEWNHVSQSGDWIPRMPNKLEEVNSKKGYILNLTYINPPSQNTLSLYGDVLAPDAKIDNIYTNRENWLGYWLYQEQHPLDAISEDDLDHIFFIQGQYWACAKMWGDGMSNPYWVSAVVIGKSVSIKYGDMVKVKTYQNISNFQWQNFGTTLIDIYDKAETENYTFIEQTAYTPIFIELDSSENLLEIGAFVEDSCVGATTVLPDDTLVLIPAYTEGINGEIYFESYYGSSKSFAPPITDYYVKDAKSNSRKKRMIHTAEKQDYYLVSFKGNQESETDEPKEQSWISCRPNPVNSSATILLYHAEDSYIEIKLYNIHGKEIARIHEGMLNKGEHSFSFNGMDHNGSPLPNGTYILSLRSANMRAQTKVVILN